METIIILALVFLFVGLRLYGVLGRRTGHEQPIPRPVDAKSAGVPPAKPRSRDDQQAPARVAEAALAPDAREGLRAITAAEPQFEPARFLEGAQAAYRMILEAFWAGDEAALRPLTDADVHASFAAAIAERRAAGHVLDNRLVTVERAMIESARLAGQTASVTVRFDADIAAVTRDADGNLVAGSLSDAVATHDLWTFSRQIRASDPNWILTETDEAA